MPKVSSKRQITLPVAGCKELGISAGDEVEILRHGDQFNIIKKVPGGSSGILKGVATDQSFTDEGSLKSHFG